MSKWYLFFRYHLDIFNAASGFVAILVECGCLTIIVISILFGSHARTFIPGSIRHYFGGHTSNIFQKGVELNTWCHFISKV